MINIPKMLGQALALCQAGKLMEARAVYLRLIKTIPNNTDVLNNLGTIELQLNNLDAGTNLLNKSIKINPNQPVAICNLGNCFLELRNYAVAIDYYKKAILLNPNYASAHYNKAKAYGGLCKFEDAIRSYERAIEIAPDFSLAYNNLGVTLTKINRNDRAIECYKFAIKLDPYFSEAHNNLGVALNDLKRYEEARSAYERAIQINPSYEEAYTNLGKSFADAKHYDQALQVYEHAIEINLDYPQAHFNKSQLCLSLFNFSQGWNEYTWRFRCADLGIKYIKSTKCEWDGSKPARRLFIWAEQGIGDQILYGSMLKDFGAFSMEITVSIEERLIPIFGRSFPTINFISQSQQYDEDNYDAHIPMGNLGKVFRTCKENFFGTANSYLLPNIEIVERIQSAKPTNKKLVCGISWFSSNKYIGTDKSIKIDSLLNLFELSHINFTNLQYGDTSNDIDLVKRILGVDIESIKNIDLYNDLDGLASVIETCDIVVTVSNTTAHMAGAMGKETLLLVPYSAAKLWYWSDVDGRSLWYPSVKIFPQKIQGDWTDPIMNIKKYLEQKS